MHQSQQLIATATSETCLVSYNPFDVTWYPMHVIHPLRPGIDYVTCYDNRARDSFEIQEVGWQYLSTAPQEDDVHGETDNGIEQVVDGQVDHGRGGGCGVVDGDDRVDVAPNVGRQEAADGAVHRQADGATRRFPLGRTCWTHCQGNDRSDPISIDSISLTSTSFILKWT